MLCSTLWYRSRGSSGVPDRMLVPPLSHSKYLSRYCTFYMSLHPCHLHPLEQSASTLTSMLWSPCAQLVAALSAAAASPSTSNSTCKGGGPQR